MKVFQILYPENSLCKLGNPLEHSKSSRMADFGERGFLGSFAVFNFKSDVQGCKEPRGSR